jgi:hypothetical protein
MHSEDRQIRMRTELGASRSRFRVAGTVVLAMALSGTLSCEHSVTIKGTVTVPVAVQQRFSSADRGRLVIWAEDAPTASPIGGETIHILCDPGSVDLRLPFDLTKFSCANEVSVQAMVFSLSGPHFATYAALPCGPVSAPTGGADPADAIAYGEQLVSVPGGACPNGTAVADITVELTQ